ncbi:MAG: hypothetical protein ACLFWB_05185 [Armatimonadota bacterium]
MIPSAGRKSGSVKPVLCPRCKNPTLPDEDGNCMMCGFCIGRVQWLISRLYLTLIAVTISTVFLGVVVFVLEQYGPPEPGGPGHLVYIFLPIAAVIGLGPVFLRKILRRVPDSQSVAKSLVIMAALAESIAVMGLVLYLVLGSLKWFVIFLGMSWLVFTMLGIQLSDAIAEYERRLVVEMEDA